MGPFGNLFVDHSRHQENRRPAKQRVLLDEFAKLVSIFVRHDDIADDGVGNCLFKLSYGGGHVGARHDIKIFTTKGDLDHLAHRGAVVDEIHVGFGNRFACGYVCHETSLSAGCWCVSSNSRKASRSKSIERRWTVRWFAVAPATSLYTPIPDRWQSLTI